MAKELDFQNGNDVIKYQDDTSTLHLHLSEDGYPFDLTRLDSLTLKVGNENGYLLQKVIDIGSIANPQNGDVTIPLDGDIMNKLVPDDYNIEMWAEVNPLSINADTNSVNVTVNNNSLVDEQAIFPSEGNLVITVDDNINAAPFNSINAYPIDDIMQAINDKIANMKTQIEGDLQNDVANQKYDGNAGEAMMFRGQWDGSFMDMVHNNVTGFYRVVDNKLGLNLDNDWSGWGIVEIWKDDGLAGNVFATIRSHEHMWVAETNGGDWVSNWIKLS